MSHSIKKTSLLSNASLSEQWDAHGYVILPQLVDTMRIDRLVAEFQQHLLASNHTLLRQPSFRRETGARQYPHAYNVAHNLTDTGFMLEGMKDPHVLSDYPAFSGAILQLLCDKAVQESLAGLMQEYDRFVLHQSMFFDFNPGTDPHQDSFYIDSEPRGKMVGLWLALEDIHEDAGRFYVVDGSHTDAPSADIYETHSNSEYLAQLNTYYNANRHRLVAPSLKKGDVIMWHGQTVHGSLSNKDNKLSRKSLTAHYVPEALVGRNTQRIFTNTIEQTICGMRYVVTNRPDVSGRKVLCSSTQTLELESETVEFQVIRTFDGEQTIIRRPFKQ